MTSATRNENLDGKWGTGSGLTVIHSRMITRSCPKPSVFQAVIGPYNTIHLNLPSVSHKTPTTNTGKFNPGSLSHPAPKLILIPSGPRKSGLYDDSRGHSGPVQTAELDEGSRKLPLSPVLSGGDGTLHGVGFWNLRSPTLGARHGPCYSGTD